ncbi:hypothetical protein BFX06_14395 [Sulfobacillus thermosulfidooxidans]|uniref:Small acid-soluble spore protein F (Minor alpha/beta-type SASP) n=2 Tax=Sulfobacillus thermosulfidooxidans TaxID=28034 RepID=A0A1W1W7R8_SULTA|nr:hypothetical protein BFX05_01660 [Sulfobacillus thermosulfidooxidans]OLZ16800.1 hypothetical protein BFX06_14395 [Sulfobacillus thermosulfidooxidans]OLZ22240.1 hypothetical protein BFX07_10275 [Sulfobacillus thermosulfidooxidans]PSR26963.1 MAG: hypothetical protein C7B47_09515 [Sulfobacillus thermosulfidooxidans]SMC02305.1 small acid-soluble spore protein F (minor alpha/beta-type SASP) [Sulfobacillus thermosulfidooxidans DSM 9293]
MHDHKLKRNNRRGGGILAKILSEATKMKLGERLGVDDIVRREGWGGVPARQCGNLVREAIRLAEEELQHHL